MHRGDRLVRPTAVISGSAAARHAAGRKRKAKCPGRRVGWSRRDWLAAGELNDDLEEEGDTVECKSGQSTSS